MRHVILGTAGHIDHGKSSLVKAMTGVDPDRLKEEKERGITIDLGFAELDYGEDLSVGIVDVPGHERLIKNMLAGAGGIDIVLMVIAADEGVMPQSIEHLNICDLLHIRSGIIVITKSDLVEPEWLDLVKSDLADFVRGTFLEDAPMIAVSSTTGANIPELIGVIKDIALDTEIKPSGGLFRLPVDRVFTLKGFGTVVTGTAVSGTVSTDEQVEVLPSNIKTKIRGLHSHGKAVKKIYAGQRGAVNLQGIEKEVLSRGDTVVTAGRFKVTRRIDATLELLKSDFELKNRSLVHFHLGTAETVARLVIYGTEILGPGEKAYCQFRLNEPLVSQAGDRFVIRRFSPLETVGGGLVLDPTPVKRKRRDGIDDLTVLETGDLEQRIAAKIKKAMLSGMTRGDIEGWVKAEIAEIRGAVGSLKGSKTIIKIEDVHIHKDSFDVFAVSLKGLIKAFHNENPMKRGMPKEEARVKLNASLKTFSALIGMVDGVEADKDTLFIKGFSAAATDDDKKLLLTELQRAGVEAPQVSDLSVSLKMDSKKVSDILRLLAQDGDAVRLTDSMYMSQKAYTTMLEALRKHYETNDDLTVAQFRDILGTTRKFALPLLEYMDSSGVTLRVGDTRKLLGKQGG